MSEAALDARVFSMLEALRGAGVSYGIGDHIRAQRVAAKVGGDRARLRRVLRAVLVRDPSLDALFEGAFTLAFEDEAPAAEHPTPRAEERAVAEVIPAARAVARAAAPAGLAVGASTVAVLAAVLSLPGPPAQGRVRRHARPDTPTQPGLCPQPDPHRDTGLARTERTTRPLVAAGGALAVGGLALAAFALRVGRRRALAHRDRFLPGPWDWRVPVEAGALGAAFTRDDVHRAAALLARADGDGATRVALRETIDATARRGGFLALVRRPSLRAAVVGFALDRSPGAAPWRTSAEALLERLHRTGAPVRRWWFDGDPRRVALRSEAPATRRLASLRAEVDALVVLGEPDIDARALGEVLRPFPRRLWLHPLPRARWSPSERAVEAVVPMAQMSITALGALGGRRFDAADDAGAPWDDVAERYPGSAAGLDALAAYLGDAFPWLCAAAVARRPERDLARLLGPRAGGARRLPWSAWLRLATLRCWDDDAWHPALREGLRSRLGDAPHRALAAALLQRLEVDAPPEESAAWWLREAERAELAASAGQSDASRVAALLASPMRDALEAPPGRGARVQAGAAVWRRAWPQLAVAGLGAGVVAAGGASLRTTAQEETWRPTRVERRARLVPCARCPEGTVWIAGGTFTMGSPEGEGSNGERPQHRVTLGGFCMERTEVTVAAYGECVARGACEAPREHAEDRGESEFFCNWRHAGREGHPVNCVSAVAAERYCMWRYPHRGNLPTEDQWEFAARGSAGRRYPWGDTPEPSPQNANLCGSECVAATRRTWWEFVSGISGWSDPWGSTAPVAELPRAGDTPEGLAGMAGNVWEWTRTSWGRYTARAGDATEYTSVDRNFRVYRGGGWHDRYPSVARAAYRHGIDTTLRDGDVGFRCVAEGR